MDTEKIDYKNIFYPPGGILLWIIIILELVTFIIGISVFLYQKSGDHETFVQSQAMLNKAFGMINTIVLLTSGFMIATSVHYLKTGDNKKSLLWIRAAYITGTLFLIIKAIEYLDKFNHGLTIAYDSFFTFYWLLTGFHFIHVLIGIIILLFLAKHIKTGAYSKDNFLDVESGAAFWHMCDLIWLLLFPVLYLLV